MNKSELDLTKPSSLRAKFRDIGFSILICYGLGLSTGFILLLVIGKPHILNFVPDNLYVIGFATVLFIYIIVKDDLLNPGFWHPEKPEWNAKLEVQKYLETA